MTKVKALCPRCKTEMTLISEIERSNGVRHINRYYRCPACTLRLMDESYRITEDGERLLLRVIQDEKRPIIIKVG
ncbi:MAG: hypothetical protein RMI00_00615 [Sulfolobales archaeon]|nr:hypothetical protein [Acidilobaceae archaeon]MDW7973760.1 hypothetical protein [Sulfolobales archaeon]